MGRRGCQRSQLQKDVGTGGDKHRLEIFRKRLLLFAVTLSPTSISGTDRRNVRSGAVELLRGLPQGIIPGERDVRPAQRNRY
jgi:hypothetical protein